ELKPSEVEVALRESEAHYRVPWTASAHGEMLDVSQRWFDLTGLTRDETVGSGWKQAVHPEDLSRVTAAWRRSVDFGEPYDIEHRLRLADGSYRWVRIRASAKRNTRGLVVRWYGFVEDVHEHHLAEAALRASEERFQLATEAVVGFLYDYDMIADRSERFGGTERALGFTKGEVMHSAQWWISRIHPDEVARVMDDVRGYLAGDASHYTHEYRFLHKDGHYIHLSDHGRIVRDADGRPIRMLGGITDVSEQKQLEQDREKLLAEVLWERSRLREIFDVAPSFFALTRGPDHVYEYVNEAYYKIAGRRELIGRRLFDVFPEAREQGFAETFERVLREGTPWTGHEVRMEVYPEGGGAPDEYFVDMTFTPFTETDGTRSGIITHGVDVSSHVRAMREVAMLLLDTESRSEQERESRLAAEKATQARDEMLRVVSHELGGPLSVVSFAVAGILASPTPSAETVQENATILKRAAEWMQRLLHDLADVASIEAGRLTLVRVPETPRALVTQAAEMFEGAGRDRQISIEAITAPDLPLLLVDPARMLQALGNLITNALKATTTGDRITVHAEPDPVGVRLSVEDDGTGIAPENLPHMFDRAWQQLHHTNAGLGLGLAIVRGIVDAHGGELKVESTLGQGSRFSFTVPSEKP
ncbi:MAG TPA: PAS domain-containing protein, partial [Gemmatimonadaceae bacterium]|nr:PAS domain-containing protein [Gemmatimonadaceae bacterium]